MQTFVRRHEANIHGVLCGFDRVRFRGTQRSICFAEGLFRYLNFLKVLLMAFKAFFDGATPSQYTFVSINSPRSLQMRSSAPVTCERKPTKRFALTTPSWSRR